MSYEIEIERAEERLLQEVDEIISLFRDMSYAFKGMCEATRKKDASEAKQCRDLLFGTIANCPVEDLVRCLDHYSNLKESEQINSIVRKLLGATA